MVSVVIPTFKRDKTIIRALKGVAAQTYGDIEIIVVDDNGKGTDHQIATEQAVQSINDSRIRYIIHDTNLGGCAARNTGIRKARGEYIAFLDDDDVWSKDYISTLILYFTSENIGAVYCDYFLYNGFFSRALKENTGYEGDVYRFILHGWCPASTSLVIVKKAIILKAGLFDEELSSFQDYDMWLRLSKICEFAHCKKYLVLKYEGFDEQTSKNPIRRTEGYCRIVEKYEKNLTDEDLVCFQDYKHKYYYDTLYRVIEYNCKHNISYDIELKEYLAKNGSLKRRLRLCLLLYLPERLYYHIKLLALKHNKNMIVYKGRYSFELND